MAGALICLWRTAPRHRPPGGTGAHWSTPEFQKADVPIFHSIERPRLTAAFGTTCPPKGLSGIIRKFAFNYSEGSFGHWLPLILADRVDMIEGIFEDILHGHLPNFYKEMGGPAELKYNPKGFARKAVTVGLVGIVFAAGISYLMKDKEKGAV